MTLPEVPPASEFVWPEVIYCHDADQHLPGHGPHYAWDGQDGHCGYCGSAHPAVVYEFLRNTEPTEHPVYRSIPPGTETLSDMRNWRTEQDARITAWRGVSVADQKYGWPHKLYLTADDPNTRKWYNVHLEDLGGTEQFKLFTELIFAHTGVRFLWYPDRTRDGRKRRGTLGYIGGH